MSDHKDIEKITRSEKEWRQLLTSEQYDIMRDAGTERAFSSPLNEEKREGTYHCRGCDLLLFRSQWKFDSGTGWPSFWEYEKGHLETKLDFKLILPRTEYHCARCGSHQGHVFEDGPKDKTGLRYCNNGAALVFKSKDG